MGDLCGLLTLRRGGFRREELPGIAVNSGHVWQISTPGAAAPEGVQLSPGNFRHRYSSLQHRLFDPRCTHCPGNAVGVPGFGGTNPPATHAWQTSGVTNANSNGPVHTEPLLNPHSTGLSDMTLGTKCLWHLPFPLGMGRAVARSGIR